MLSDCRTTVQLLVVAAVVGSLLAVGAAAVTGSHVGEAEYDAGDASNFTVHTYTGPDAGQRGPGDTDRSYWTESVVYEIPDGESVYLQESVTYRPVPSDCSPGDTDEFGIDRDATDQGERETDEDIMDSVKSFQLDEAVRPEYEDGPGEYGDLTTADEWGYIERITVDWYGPDDFGSPVRLSRGDRFVTAQRDCLDNPDAAGWYRWAGINAIELENGTKIQQERPTFSHWYWICDCKDRSEAVEKLGPPPSERSAESGARSETDGSASTPTQVAETPTPSEPEADSPMEGTPPADGGGGDDQTATPISTPTAQTQSTPAPAESEGWGERIYQTPTPARGQGPGFTPSTAVVALLLSVVALGYRR